GEKGESADPGCRDGPACEPAQRRTEEAANLGPDQAEEEKRHDGNDTRGDEDPRGEGPARTPPGETPVAVAGRQGGPCRQQRRYRTARVGHRHKEATAQPRPGRRQEVTLE